MKKIMLVIILGAVALLGESGLVTAQMLARHQFFAELNQTSPTQQLAAVAKDTWKYDSKIERHTVLNVQPQPAVSDFQDCAAIAASGYVGSVIAQQTTASNESSEKRLASNAPGSLRGGLAIPNIKQIRKQIRFPTANGNAFVAALPDDLLAQAPAVPPPTPRTGGPVTTNPRTPYLRIVAKNPWRCAIGSATVSSPSTFRLSLKPGELVELRVTSAVFGSTYYSLWVEDTYRLTAQESGPVNFSKIVVAGAFVGNDANYIYSNTLKAVNRMPNGALVGFQTFQGGTPGNRIACNYKPRAGALGTGSISCLPGTPWPIKG